jgi:hypothetical protein
MNLDRKGGEWKNRETQGGELTNNSLLQNGDPADGIPPDGILYIFDLHSVADERGS